MKPALALYVLIFCLFGKLQAQSNHDVQVDVLVIGGTASGIAAGIQSARMGVPTMVVESGPWLGGMLTSSGVSAIDGNYRLPSGLFGEFVEALANHYGGKNQLKTGWVSNTLFEPRVGQAILQGMAAKEQKYLRVWLDHRFDRLLMEQGKVIGAEFISLKTQTRRRVLAQQIIDATELGDAAKQAGIPYDIGLEASTSTGENINILKTEPIVQDLTWVAILKDYKKPQALIPRPAGYDSTEFDASNTDFYLDKTRKKPGVSALKMLEYGKLPGDKYMLNWPIYGNDHYANMIDASPEERASMTEAAKQQTLRFVYFIQKDLKFSHLGLADDEFPTTDRLAIQAYHRESRRIHGLVRFKLPHITHPYDAAQAPLYRTGIAVGDYPIDHHHKKNLAAPQQLEFFPVPSFSLPLGTLLAPHSNLIVAEKSISVSNVVNGTTRLQPCVLQIGQAAGALAALAAKAKQDPKAIPVRSLQAALLEAGMMIQPYVDVPKSHPHFKAIQKLASTGLIRGIGVPGQWENYSYFYPEALVSNTDLRLVMMEKFPQAQNLPAQGYLTWEQLLPSLQLLMPDRKVPDLEKEVFSKWADWGFDFLVKKRPLKKVEAAVILDHFHAFERFQCNHEGRY